mgnify:CR=1 FL=1
MATQVVLPGGSTGAGVEETQERIVAARAALGKRLIVLGHHYQRDEVIRHADVTGDSFKLGPGRGQRGRRRSSSSSAACTSWRSRPTSSPADHQKVILPDLTAGCTMADMAEIGPGRGLLGRGHRRGRRATSLPVTYMNSTRGAQGVRGPPRRRGVHVVERARGARLGASARSRACCSSRPAPGPQHRATGMGIPLERDAGVGSLRGRGGAHRGADPRRADRAVEGPLLRPQPLHPRHGRPRAARRSPACKVIVHPECRFEVAQKVGRHRLDRGDHQGRAGEPGGTKWAVGTELNLVTRLARECAPDRQVVSLDDCFCVCSTMFRIDPPHLLWVLENLAEGRVVNQVTGAAAPPPEREALSTACWRSDRARRETNLLGGLRRRLRGRTDAADPLNSDLVQDQRREALKGHRAPGESKPLSLWPRGKEAMERTEVHGRHGDADASRAQGRGHARDGARWPSASEVEPEIIRGRGRARAHGHPRQREPRRPRSHGHRHQRALQDQREHRQLRRSTRTSSRSWRSSTRPCTSAPTP